MPVGHWAICTTGAGGRRRFCTICTTWRLTRLQLYPPPTAATMMMMMMMMAMIHHQPQPPPPQPPPPHDESPQLGAPTSPESVCEAAAIARRSASESPPVSRSTQTRSISACSLM